MELLSGIGLVAAAIGSVVGIMEGCKKFCQHVVIPIKQHFEMVHQSFASIDALKADLASLKKKIDYELNPNGGGSLKDEVKTFGRFHYRLEGVVLSLLSSIDKGVWIFDENGKCLWGNFWFERRLGWSSEEMRDHGWKNIILASMREKVSNEFNDAVKDGRNFIIDYTCTHRENANILINVHVICSPIKRDNQIIGYVSFASEFSTL